MNRKYLIHLFKTNKILLFVQTLICLVLYLWLALQQTNNLVNASFDFHEVGLGQMYMVLSAIAYAFFISIKYYQMRNLDVYDSLPYKKHHRKMIEVLFGWLMYALPFIISLLIGIVYINAFNMNQSTNSFIQISLTILFSSSILYTLLVFLLSLCTSIKEGIINTMIVMFLGMFATSSIMQFISGNVINVSFQPNADSISEIFTVILNLISGLSPIPMYITNMTNDTNRIAFIITVIIIAIFIGATYYFAKKRKAEYVGMRKKCLPLYFVGLGITSFLLIISSMNQSNSFNDTLFVWLSIIIGALIATLVYERKRKVLILCLIVSIGVGIGAYSLRYVLVQSEAFGRSRTYKEISNKVEIDVVFNSYTYDLNQLSSSPQKNYKIKAGKLSDKVFYQELEKMQDAFVDEFKKSRIRFEKQTDSDEYFDNYVNYYELGKEPNSSVLLNKIYSYDLNEKQFKKWLSHFEKLGCEVEISTYEMGSEQ